MSLAPKVDTLDTFLIETAPPALVIVAAGPTPTPGWTNARLVAVQYVQPPQDGIYDYYFLADPPTGVVIQPVGRVAAKAVRVDDLERLRGVRVHAWANSRTLVLEQAATAAACDPTKLVGKPLTDELRAALPEGTRIFTPEAPFGTTDYRPDRLNLELDGDGIITNVCWG